MSDKLILECPFCHTQKPRLWHRWGNPTRYYDEERGEWMSRDMYYVKCLHCKMQGPMLPSETQAIGVWNMIRDVM